MEPVQFNCPLCAGLFQIDPSMAGGQVLCPNCQGTISIPDLSAAPSADLQAQPGMQLACPLCTGIFQVTPEMAGQQVACPHCDGQVMLPAEIVSTSTSADAKPVDDRMPPASQPQVSQQTPEVSPTRQVPAQDAKGDAAAKSAPDAAAGDSNLFPPGFAPQAAKKQDSQRPKSGSPSANVKSPAAESDPRYPPGTAPPAASSEGQPTSSVKADRKTAAESPIARPESKPAPRNVDAMLPPGAADTEASTPRPEAKNPIDAMLPPGGTADAPAKKASKADSLLPPGAEAGSSDSAIQRALPETGQQRPVKVEKDIVIPTEDGGVVTLHEPERVVGEGAKRVRLHSLSTEEKTRKRSFKSLIVWLLCVIVLVVAMALLLRK